MDWPAARARRRTGKTHRLPTDARRDGRDAETRRHTHAQAGALALSHDQTPFSKDERERIKACGGRIMSADQVDGLVPYHENWDCNLGEELDDDGDPRAAAPPSARVEGVTRD